MKLLDAVEVNPPDRWAGNHWEMGYTGVQRECAVQMEVEVPCPPDVSTWNSTVTPLIGTVDSRKGTYWVQPFPVRSFLRQSVTCEQPDDKDWLLAAVRAKSDFLVGRALVNQVSATAETWIGNAAVQSVALAATPTSANWRTSVGAARKQWVKSTVSTLERPLMHVPPSLVGELQAASLLLITGPEEVSSVTGDKVIISDGYDDVTTPKVFFTGEVIVRLSNVDDEGGPLYDHRINNYSLSLNEWAAVDFAPCATVRVGV